MGRLKSAHKIFGGEKLKSMSGQHAGFVPILLQKSKTEQSPNLATYSYRNEEGYRPRRRFSGRPDCLSAARDGASAFRSVASSHGADLIRSASAERTTRSTNTNSMIWSQIRSPNS
jgi:hypothetical protein